MQTSQPIRTGIVAVALTAACGSSGSGSSGATADDIASYRQSVLDVQSSATAYQASMMDASMTTVANCQEVHDQYDADVRPPVALMGAMSADMDTFMGHHGGSAMSDVGCTADGMSGEIDRHHSVACSLPDLPAEQAEAVRHVGIMTSYANHLSDRSAQMMGALNGETRTWGPMMSGCAGWSGMGMMMHGGASR